MAPELHTILQLKVPVIVQIGRCGMSMDDILALQPGSILELDKHADDELSLLINNKHIGSGGAVKVGENFGLRISEIGSARQRIAALADGASGDADDTTDQTSDGAAREAAEPAAGQSQA
ncbi:MAG: FliM/FliN family flagellar motor switch protein [Phycisphaeraceae bacterium]